MEEEQLFHIDWDESKKHREYEQNIEPDQFLEKFFQFEDNYFNKAVENSTSIYAYTKNTISTYFDDNLRYVKGNLTGFLITLFYEAKRFFAEDELLQIVSEELPKLRKNNGSKYYVML
jgi:hypothetical protein